MNVDQPVTSIEFPPPEDRTEGWKPIEAEGGGERYWDGAGWTDRTRTKREGIATRILALYTAFLKRVGVGSAAGLVALLVMLVLVFVTAAMGMRWGGLLGGDDSGSADEVEQSEEPEPAEQGSPSAQEEESEAPVATEPEVVEVPSGAEVAVVDGEVSSSSAADCEPRTFAGNVTVSFEGWPAGTALTSDARFVIDAGPHIDAPRSGCRSTADLVWLGSGTDPRFRHEVNPSGSFCSILLGEEGVAVEPPLVFTPDGQGGGTLTGTMFVRGQVGWVSDFAGFAQTCPSAERALQYAFPLDPPVVGEFTATVSDGLLVGGGTFVDPRGFTFEGLAPSGGIGGRTTYVVEVTASETAG